MVEAAGGSVLSVQLPKDRASGRPRGFGFVTVSSPEEAARVRSSLDGSIQSGRSISVRLFSADAPRPAANRPSTPGKSDERTVYVGNLPFDAEAAELETMFAPAGPVVRVQLPTGADGRPRGFGFVTMGSSKVAHDAVTAFAGLLLRGRRLNIGMAQGRVVRSSGEPQMTSRGGRSDAQSSAGGRPQSTERSRGGSEQTEPDAADDD